MARPSRRKPQSGNVIIGIVALCGIVLYLIYIASQYTSTHPDQGSASLFKTAVPDAVISLLDSQNSTIAELLVLLEGNKYSAVDKGRILDTHTRQNGDIQVDLLQQKIKLLEAELLATTQEQQNSLATLSNNQNNLVVALPPPVASSTSNNGPAIGFSSSIGLDGTISPNPNHYQYPFALVPKDRECEDRFGLGLAELWKKARTPYCTMRPDQSNDQLQSSLHCYPYTQVHKRARSYTGPKVDMFCEAKNMFIDFSKIRGDHGATKLARGVQQYHNFGPGSTFANCRKTPQFNIQNFMNHQRLQMATFQDNRPLPAPGTYTTEDSPTYLLARDEDCENMFHSTADFMNMFLVYRMLGLTPHQTQVVLFDKHPDGPYKELMQAAFSDRTARQRPLKRASHYRANGHNGLVLFRHLVFHLESPAGIIFPKVSGPEPMRCRSSSLYHAYRHHILSAFDLWDVPPPAVPQITLTVRRRTATKNVGRVISNEPELEAVLKEGNMLHYEVVDMAQLQSFRDQLKVMRSTNVLVGLHGAGLMHIMFCAEEAVLVEVHPQYRMDRHFRHAARLSGKVYMPHRSEVPPHCKGTSDDNRIDKAKFRAVMDGAVRLARSFDDGLSECGLYCNPSVLAMDDRLDKEYGKMANPQHRQKGKAFSHRFPCY